MNLEDQLIQISKKIQSEINNALKSKVLEVVKEEEVNAIDDIVYGAYSPKIYERRDGSGGLSDPSNIKYNVSNGELHVWNATMPNPGGVRDSKWVTTSKYLDQLIEYGHGRRGKYDFPRNGRAYMEPRPFTQETIDRLEKNKKHITALKESLESQGLNIK